MSADDIIPVEEFVEAIMRAEALRDKLPSRVDLTNDELIDEVVRLGIVTDPTLELQQALRQYVWRWEIEVNFRDQKTLLGVGQAQVRQPDSVERVPQFQTAAYALLLLAGARWSRRHGAPEALPQPHWQRHRQPQRVTTSHLIQHLRADLWADGLSAQSFCGFATAPPGDQQPQKLPGALLAAAIFACG